MLRTAVMLCLILISSASAREQDDSKCLPRSVFPKNPEEAITFKLGFARGAPTLCVPSNADRTAYERCWTVNAKSGVLSASAATRLMGRSTAATTGPDGCVENYCPVPKPGADQKALFAMSTDDTHAVILVDRTLHVFDARTRAQTAVIPISDEKAASDTNIGNEPIEILYLGHTLYVAGSDAGPFIGVWLYKDDGKRLGRATDPQKAGQEDATFSVYAGAANIIDDKHVALANAGLRTVQIFDETGKKVQELKRPVAIAPCTAEDMINVDIADVDQLPRSCRLHVRKTFEPYFDVEPVRLPTGDMLIALSGKYLGSLAILDGKTLMEKKRLTLERCGG